MSGSAAALRGVRRAAVIVVIVCLVIAAILGIIALLSGDFGEIQGKVLLTTLAIAGFSITALCHLAIVQRALRVVGYVGIAASIAALVPALVLVWHDWSGFVGDGWVKALGVLTVLAVSLAQANLLLLLATRHRLVVRIALGVALLAITVVAVMVILPIVTDGTIPGDEGDAYWRAFGVVAILDVLGTIALPVLGLVLKDTPQIRVQLTPELAERLDAAASAAGVSREAAALGALERGLSDRA